MNRRSFLNRSFACLAAMVLAPVRAVADIPETVDIDWFRVTRLDGETFGFAEIRFCVDGGSWRVKRFRLTESQPVAWLGRRLGLNFRSVLFEEKNVGVFVHERLTA